MKKSKVLIGITIIVLFTAFQIVNAMLGSVDGYSYKGAKKCKMCHQSSARGKQYQDWKESVHAGAYATLATDRSKEVAAAAGIEGDPQKSDNCLSCHTTGHGAPAELREASLTLEEGVSCEACHGPGSGYFKLNTMKKITAGEIEGSSVGLVATTKELCVTCHNEKSPTYQEFDFEKRYAEVVHPPKAAK